MGHRTTVYVPDHLWERMRSQLPPSETVSGLLSAALAARLGDLEGCGHARCRCEDCGATVNVLGLEIPAQNRSRRPRAKG